MPRLAEVRSSGSITLPLMLILALESVTRAGSMAIWRDGTIEARAGDPARTHGERLPADVLQWLAALGHDIRHVDLFAVVTGPGSFTGLRVGVATVQGFAHASQRRAIGVPTLEALAESAIPTLRSPTIVMPCLDGQRGDVFFAAFEIAPGQPIESARLLIAPAVGTPEQAAANLARLEIPRGGLIVGDGATRYSDRLTAAAPAATIVGAPEPLAAAAVAMAARRQQQAGPPHALRPIYTRRPDAVLARERAGIATPPFVVRETKATPDLAAVEALQRETFTNPWGADAIRWELEHTDVARLFVLEPPDGPVVAYCACWMVFDELHINSLAVAPAWRRRGAATHLLKAVLQRARAEGARSATLEVRASNEAARNLYERLDFRVEGVRRDYYQSPREDALILWRRGL
jgi:ribosomal-protein-alanine N-acetyltransferase